MKFRYLFLPLELRKYEERYPSLSGFWYRGRRTAGPGHNQNVTDSTGEQLAVPASQTWYS